MANDSKKQKQGKQPAEKPMRAPMRKPEQGNVDIERDRSSTRNPDVEGANVIDNDEEVELKVDDLDDLEDEQITGRHPSQRDRDLK